MLRLLYLAEDIRRRIDSVRGACHLAGLVGCIRPARVAKCRVRQGPVRCRSGLLSLGPLCHAVRARARDSCQPASLLLVRGDPSSTVGAMLCSASHAVNGVGCHCHGSFLCYGLSLDQELYPVLMRSGHIFLLAEASTTCINLRYLAFRAGCEQQAKCWEILFIVSFVATRVIIGIPLSASWWLHDLPRIRTSTVASFYMASNLAWNAMNVLTVWRIFLAYWRHGGLRSPSRCASSKQLQVQDTNPRKAEPASKAGPAADKMLSIQLPPSSAPCVSDDEVACQLTVSSALDCHMDLWLLSAPAQSGSSVAAPDPDATAMQSHGQRPELAGRRGWAEGAGGWERRPGLAHRLEARCGYMQRRAVLVQRF